MYIDNLNMSKKSPIAIFMAASALLATSTVDPSIAGEKKGFLGGLKEWSTDQSIDEKSKLDKDAAAAAKKAKEENVCIPIGEGENCW